MSGKKGMVPTRPKAGCKRRNIWRSIRILRVFTVSDLCRTASVEYDNARKFVRNLNRHTYVAKHGEHTRGRGGSFQSYRLVRDIGPEYPTVCDLCGKPITGPCEVNR